MPPPGTPQYSLLCSLNDPLHTPLCTPSKRKRSCPWPLSAALNWYPHPIGVALFCEPMHPFVPSVALCPLQQEVPRSVSPSMHSSVFSGRLLANLEVELVSLISQWHDCCFFLRRDFVIISRNILLSSF